MTSEHLSNEDVARGFWQRLSEAGLGDHSEALKGGTRAVQLQHVMMLKERAREGEGALQRALGEAGVVPAGDREKLSQLLLAELEEREGLTLKTPTASPVELASEAWQNEMADGDGQLPADIAAAAAGVNDTVGDGNRRDADGEVWPAGMKIVNGDQACSIRAQGMIQQPNHYGYIHLAAEVERPRWFNKKSARKTSLLTSLKKAARLLEESVDVQRADVFDAFMIPPGSKEGRAVLEDGRYDVHIAEFDVVVLVECPDVAAAQRVRASEGFQLVKQLLDDAASFVHCITAKNAKRIAEVEKESDAIFLFNYFFAADIASKGAAGVDILLGVWEYTAGWWTAKANLTNSTPLQPLPGEYSQYSLVNHCRWDRALDVFPALVFRPTLDSFVLKNFTANDIMAMPVLYHLA